MVVTCHKIVQSCVCVQTDLLELIWLVEVWHFTRREYIIDILQEGLLYDLCVSEEEYTRLVLSSSLEVELAEVLPELLEAVVTCDFNLEDRVLQRVGGESTEALSTTPTHSNQQHVTTRLANHTNDTTYCV